MRQRKNVLNVLWAALGAACAVVASTPAQSQTGNYPSRPLRMIIPYAPGGASDFVGRILQPKLAEALGQQIVVDNRPGASGNIGVETAARATPDGYTFLLGNVSSMGIGPSMFPNFPVRALENLETYSGQFPSRRRCRARKCNRRVWHAPQFLRRYFPRLQAGCRRQSVGQALLRASVVKCGRRNRTHRPAHRE